MVLYLQRRQFTIIWDLNGFEMPAKPFRSTRTKWISLAVSLVSPLLPLSASAESPMSLEMLESRAISALTALYSQTTPGKAYVCETRRRDGEPTGFFIRCGVQGSNEFEHYWTAGAIEGQVVALCPLSEKAVAASPAPGSGMPPENDAGFLRVGSCDNQSRKDDLQRALAAFE